MRTPKPKSESWYKSVYNKFRSKPRKISGRKIPYKCVDGPLHGHNLYLTTPSTVVFSIGSFIGRYIECDNHIEWQELTKG
jgi:hypothetical protein